MRRAVEEIKEQLGVSDNEWSVVKPRVEAVYDLMHPRQQFGRGDARSMAPAEQRSRELRELLANKEAKPEEIKAKLTALRAAKEQAPSGTRQGSAGPAPDHDPAAGGGARLERAAGLNPVSVCGLRRRLAGRR